MPVSILSNVATAAFHTIPFTLIVVLAFGYRGVLTIAAIFLTILITLFVQLPLIRHPTTGLFLVAVFSVPIALLSFNAIAFVWAMLAGMPYSFIWADSFALALAIPLWFWGMRAIT
ncbi:hypothetical protein X907_2445 [Glycocaulis alkaliphilus]|uniref:Uncharacterized protein n=2 Tax=Glycocaulis alkaliphilus TaxID=1434191 RepID=A0A3T0ECD4_9PROT|nr:hypothetical protein X907_2445 [Glycocaulis alkaliphilus]